MSPAREARHATSSAVVAAFEATRPAIAVEAVGVGRADHEYRSTIEKSQTFGCLIIEHEAIVSKLADTRTRLDAARAFGHESGVDGHDG